MLINGVEWLVGDEVENQNEYQTTSPSATLLPIGIYHISSFGSYGDHSVTIRVHFEELPSNESIVVWRNQDNEWTINHSARQREEQGNSDQGEQLATAGAGAVINGINYEIGDRIRLLTREYAVGGVLEPGTELQITRFGSRAHRIDGMLAIFATDGTTEYLFSIFLDRQEFVKINDIPTTQMEPGDDDDGLPELSEFEVGDRVIIANLPTNDTYHSQFLNKVGTIINFNPSSSAANPIVIEFDDLEGPAFFKPEEIRKIQEEDPITFQPGEHVKIIQGYGIGRVGIFEEYYPTSKTCRVFFGDMQDGKKVYQYVFPKNLAETSEELWVPKYNIGDIVNIVDYELAKKGKVVEILHYKQMYGIDPGDGASRTFYETDLAPYIPPKTVMTSDDLEELPDDPTDQDIRFKKLDLDETIQNLFVDQYKKLLPESYQFLELYQIQGEMIIKTDRNNEDIYTELRALPGIVIFRPEGAAQQIGNDDSYKAHLSFHVKFDPFQKLTAITPRQYVMTCAQRISRIKGVLKVLFFPNTLKFIGKKYMKESAKKEDIIQKLFTESYSKMMNS